MGGSSGQQPAQTTQTSDPWSGVQPFLSTLYGNANQQFTNDVGYQPFGGNLQAPLSPDLATALQLQYNIADPERYGSPGVNAARDYGLQQLQSGGLTPGHQTAIGGLLAATPQYDIGWQKAQGVYDEASGQQNPYLLSQIAANDRRIGDRINAGMSGAGRYGSGAHTDVMARSLAEAANPILAADYSQRQQTKLAALQAMQAATGGRVGVSEGLANIYSGGQDVAGKWSQLIPSLDEARYAGAQHLQDYGKFYQDRTNQDLANQVAVWNAQQARPWEQLSRYQNILSGAGGLGGTKVTTQNPYQPSTLQRIGGGALAGAGLGASFGGPMGAGIGAAGGGLLGLL